ncbi:hypothetical protein GCM10027343_41410 [Noviherbaspirillum agri]
MDALAFTAVRLAAGELEAFCARLDQALFLQVAKSASPEQETQYRHAWQLLNRHRPTFQRLASEALQQALLQAVQAMGRRNVVSQQGDAGELLPVTSFAEMERQAQIDSLSHDLDASDYDALAVLSLRIAHLMQRDDSSTEQNPFRSEVFLKAVAEAWRKFDTQSDSLPLVLPQMQPSVFLPLGAIWQEMNRDLAARGLLPGAEEIWRRKRKEAPQPIVRPLPERLRRWLVADGKVSLACGGELFERMFEQLDVDDTIPSTVRELVAQLKEVLSPLACGDMAFFFDPTHPARRLLNAVIDGGLGLDGSEDGADPVWQEVQHAVEQLLRDGATVAARHLTVADDIATATLQQVQADQEMLRDAIAEANAQEKASQAFALAEADVAPRLESGEVESFLEPFLQLHWVRVLARAHEKHPAELPAALTTMDDLIWSAKPRSAPEERKELVVRLPTLLAELNAGLDAINWVDPERDTFFAELAQHHAACMRGPLELTPRDELEHRMDAMQRASEHELSRRAREQQKVEVAMLMRQAQPLHPGGWVEFVRNDGRKVNCKLIWISPERGCFVFSGHKGKLVFTLEDKALAQALRMERATALAPDALVKRALSSALDTVGVGGGAQ